MFKNIVLLSLLSTTLLLSANLEDKKEKPRTFLDRTSHSFETFKESKLEQYKIHRETELCIIDSKSKSDIRTCEIVSKSKLRALNKFLRADPTYKLKVSMSQEEYEKKLKDGLLKLEKEKKDKKKDKK